MMHQEACLYAHACVWVCRDDKVSREPISTIKSGDILMVLVEGHLVRGSVVMSCTPTNKVIKIRTIRMSLDGELDHIAVPREGCVQYPDNPNWMSESDLRQIKGVLGSKAKSDDNYIVTFAKCTPPTEAICCFDGFINFCYKP
jgi:hypothetical protein